MAPKRERPSAKQKAKEDQGLASGPVLDAEQQAALDRSKHLQELAVQNGVRCASLLGQVASARW